MSGREPRVEDLDDPSLDWDCSPPVDAEDQPHPSMWITEFVDLHVGHEKMSIPWTERQKNLRALRARLINDA
jgi:hypothetical protein